MPIMAPNTTPPARPPYTPCVKLLTSMNHPRIRAGDPAAIQAVVETYRPQILRASHGAGLDHQQAEDVTQETFSTFVEKASRFEGRSSVRTWLFGILYKKIAEARRTRHDRQMEEMDETVDRRVDVGGQSPTLRPPDAALFDKEVETAVFACLDAAPRRLSLAFLLREVEGLSAADICNALGITRTNLWVMLHRIRHRVRSCLEAVGVSAKAWGDREEHRAHSAGAK